MITLPRPTREVVPIPTREVVPRQSRPLTPHAVQDVTRGQLQGFLNRLAEEGRQDTTRRRRKTAAITSFSAS
jgi:hypothetical protein